MPRVCGLAARAQQPERARRVGILMAGSTEELDYQARVAASLKELQQLGWSEGRNLRAEVRLGTAPRRVFARI